MRKVIKGILWGTGTLVAIFILALIAAKIYFTKDRVLAIVLPPIEERLGRPVTIADAGISLWGGVGVYVAGVEVGNSPEFGPEPLAGIGTIDVKARFWPLFLGRVEIDRIEIEQPQLSIKVDSLGRSNLEGLMAARTTVDSTSIGAPGSGGIANGTPPQSVPQVEAARPKVAENASPPDSTISPSKRAGLEQESNVATAPPVYFDKIQLRHGMLNYQNEEVKRRMMVGGIGLDVSFRGDSINPFASFDALLKVDSGMYADPKRQFSLSGWLPLVFSRAGFVADRQRLDIDSLTAVFGALNITGSGHFEFGDNAAMSLNSRIAPIDIGEFLASIPPEVIDAGTDSLLAELALGGQLSGDLVARRDDELGSEMEWSAEINIDDFRTRIPVVRLGVDADRLALSIIEDELIVVTDNGRLAGRPLTFRADLIGFSESRFTVTARSNIELSQLNELINEQDAEQTELAGTVGFNLTAIGAVDSWRKLSVTGALSGKDVSYRTAVSTNVIRDANFRIATDKGVVTIEELRLKYGRSDFALTGRVDGLVALVLAEDHVAPPPSMTFTLHSHFLDLDELTAEEEPVESGAAGHAPVSDSTGPPIPPFLAKGKVTADSVVWTGFTMTKLQGDARFSDMTLVLDPASAKLYDGEAAGTVTWNINDWDRPVFDVTSQARKVEVSTFLTQFGSWTTMLGKRLSGRMDLDLSIKGAGDEAVEILPSLTGSGTMDLREGRLENVELLSQLAGVLGGRGFEVPVLLRELVTAFTLVDGRLQTDRLAFKTDDGDFSATGSVGFDGSLDYDIAWKLSEKAARNLGDLTKALSLLDQNRSQTPTVDLRLTGTAVQPNLQIDTKDLGRKALESILGSPDDSTKSKPTLPGLLKDILKKKK